eukprot:PLAT6852.1.p1 GENE.PLAT6852.1~~PLAT6852.1.p1  ORF type:complete len:2728 (+),score=1148.07 PLAT6852.1:1104-8186(+)
MEARFEAEGIARAERQTAEDRWYLQARRAMQLEAEKREVEEAEEPVATLLLKEARLEVTRMKKGIRQQLRALQDAQSELAMLKEEGEEVGRSMLIIAEGTVESARTELLQAREALKEAERRKAIMRRRAELEQRFYPVFGALRSGHEQLTDRLQFVTILALLCGAPLPGKLEFVFNLYDTSSRAVLREVDVRRLLSNAVRALEAVGQVKQQLPVLEIERLAAAAQMSSGGLITLPEFQKWARITVEASEDLCALLGVSWRYARFGRFQRDNMHPLHKFRLGMISYDALVSDLARMKARYWPQLEPDRKREMHARALSMGGRDPHKTDFREILKRHQKAEREVAKQEPVRVGAYRSVRHSMRERYWRACVLLQRVYRGWMARRVFIVNRRRRLLQEQCDAELARRFTKIRAKFAKREASEGQSRVKWDARVRMKRIKLRAEGKAVDREQTVAVMLEEDLDAARISLNRKYQQLRVEQGLDKDPPPPPQVRLQLSGIVTQVTFRPLPRLLRTQHELRKDTIGALLRGDTDSAVTARLSEEGHLQARQLSAVLRLPVSTTSLLYFRMLACAPGVSEMSVQRLLDRFPSKRLLMSVCEQIGSVAAVARMLSVQFGMFLPAATQLAKHMIAMTMDDLEFGSMSIRLSNWLARQELYVERISRARVMGGRSAPISSRVAGAATAREASSRGMGGGGGGGGGGKTADGVEESKADSVSARLRELRKEVRVAKVTLREAKEDLTRKYDEMERLQARTRAAAKTIRVEDQDRISWNERLQFAMELPEGDDKQCLAKYEEVHRVITSFLRTAEMFGRTIVEELDLPEHRKTIQPVISRQLAPMRPKYQVFVISNIRFVFALDYDGRFGGSHEAAAKSAGNAIRAGMHMTKLRYENIHMPLEATIDYHGLRLVASSIVPYDRGKRGSLVFGSEDLGASIRNESVEFSSALRAVGERLNLAVHSVCGLRDELRTEVPMAADVLGVIGDDGRLYAMQFGRLFPPESPSETPHLLRLEMACSVMWRQLRPEFCRRHDVPLSSDALSDFTQRAPDWEEQAKDVDDATHELVWDLIPEFVGQLAELSEEALRSYDLTVAMHRAGINMRHLGYMRSLLWHEVHGKVHTIFGSNRLMATEDLRSQLPAGTIVSIRGFSYGLRSVHLTELFLDREVDGDSARDVPLYAGGIGEIGQTQPLRDLLLTEIACRTMKQVVRRGLRQLSKLSPTPSSELRIMLLVYYLNLVSGSSDESERFYDEELVPNISLRFGQTALTLQEKRNSKKALEHLLVPILLGLQDMLGFKLHDRCRSKLEETALGFLFTAQDVEMWTSRTKCNMDSLLYFAQGTVSAIRAQTLEQTSYQNLVATDGALVHWPFCDRPRTHYAENLGSAGAALRPRYVDGIALIRTKVAPVHNTGKTDRIRVARFDGSKEVYMQLPPDEGLVPLIRSQHLTIEMWARPTETAGSLYATPLACGRYELTITPSGHWQFGLYVREYRCNVRLTGPLVEYNEWSHVVGVYNVEQMVLYVNGELVAELFVEPSARARRDMKDGGKRLRMEKLMAKEAAEQEAVTDKVERKAEAFFETREGITWLDDAVASMEPSRAERIRQGLRGLRGGAESDSDGEDGLVSEVSSVGDPRELAKTQYLREQLAAALRKVDMKYNELRSKEKARDDQFRELAQKRAAQGMRLGCGLSNVREGTHFYSGELCHVAMYPSSLSKQAVWMHYVVGSKDRATELDRLYSLALDQLIQSLNGVLDDPGPLQRFAKTLCAHARFDSQRLGDDRSFKRRIMEAIHMFRVHRNADGIAEILFSLPDDDEYSDLCCEALDTVKDIDALYVDRHIKRFAELPDKFGLGGPGQSRYKKKHAAQIYASLLHQFPTFYSSSDLAWISELKSPFLVLFFVSRVKWGYDMLDLDITQFFEDVTDDDLEKVFENCPSLASINMAGCGTSDDVGRLLGESCKRLRGVNLNDNPAISDTTLAALAEHCVMLEQVRVSGNDLVTDAGITCIATHCPSLEAIDVSRCRYFTDSSLVAIVRNCSELVELDVSWCLKVTDEGMTMLGNSASMSKLQKLTLTGCTRIADTALVAVARTCTEMTHLNLNGCSKLSDVGVRAAVHNMWKLRQLHCAGLSKLTDDVFYFDAADGRAAADKQMLRAIEVLDLTDCVLLTDHGVRGIGIRCEQLERITLGGCINLTDASVDFLARHPFSSKAAREKLKVLDMCYVRALTDSAVEQLTDAFPRLNTLLLGGCIQLTREAVALIADTMDGVTRLNLAHVRVLQSEDVVLMAENMWVEEADFSHCIRLTDEAMQAIAASWVGLRLLDISWCRSITDAGIQALAERLELLEQLTLRNCDGISDAVLSAVQASNPKVVIKRA